jgi:hypothetical protein
MAACLLVILLGLLAPATLGTPPHSNDHLQHGINIRIRGIAANVVLVRALFISVRGFILGFGELGLRLCLIAGGLQDVVFYADRLHGEEFAALEEVTNTTALLAGDPGLVGV